MVKVKNEAPVNVLPLAEYVMMAEERAQPLAVVEVTHPAAVNGDIHVGTYAGIRLVKGDAVSAKLSDGSVI